MSNRDKCNSFHELGGMRCVRQVGHEGLCWNKAVVTKDGVLHRGEWYSENGKFKRHHQYVTSYGHRGKN